MHCLANLLLKNFGGVGQKISAWTSLCLYQAKEILTMKKRQVRIAIGAVISVALIFAGFIMFRSNARTEKIVKLEKILVAYCDELNQTSQYAEFRKILDELVYPLINDSVSTDVYERVFSDCSNANYERLVPTTTIKASVAEPSGAEAEAEGRTCAQQWGRAHTETMSGGDQDIQLRATLYACDSVEDWTKEAINNGEWSDYLQMVACALEAGAPKRICG